MTLTLLLQEDVFVWSKQWYPLAAVEDLNPSKPFATKLLGESATPLRNAACVIIIGRWRTCKGGGEHQANCNLVCRQGHGDMEGWGAAVAML